MSILRSTVITSVLAVWLPALSPQPGLRPGACKDGWTPPSGRPVEVANIDQLEQAIHNARPGDSILVADGDYAHRGGLDIKTANVALRGRSGDPAKVVIHGGGMIDDQVGVGIGVSATGVTVADITLRDFKYHAIQVRGEAGASRFTLHNARLIDTGQQLLKVSVSTNGLYADDGLVACSSFSFSDHAPSDYTNGIDLLAAKGWVIRDNYFARIRGPQHSAGPTILAWSGSEDTLVERNVIVDSFRGIALGLQAAAGNLARNGIRDYDHLRGIVRNNVIVNLNPWADEAIEANGARDARIEFNTILAEGATTPWSIGVRWPSGNALVRNNLTNQQILLRNGAHAIQQGNVTMATRSWFVNAPDGDLHLGPGGSRAIGVGVLIPDVPTDFDKRPRTVGRLPDAGAFESPGGGPGPR